MLSLQRWVADVSDNDDDKNDDHEKILMAKHNCWKRILFIM